MPCPDRVQKEYERVSKILRTTPFHQCFDLREDTNQRLPLNPGHYAFRIEKEILYIGKASNLRTRLNYSHPVFRRLWMDLIQPEQVRLIWEPTTARYVDYLLWIEKRMLFVLRPR